MRILLAEDEPDLNEVLRQKLTAEGYSVDSFRNGKDALEVLSYTDYDAAVLDIMMPGADGYAVLRSLRESGKTTPVLFLTARDTVADRIKGLDSGANDYLVKPFSLEELCARLRVLTRGSQTAASVIRVGDLSLDRSTRRVERGGEEILLSAKEFALLEYLMVNKGRVLSREKIENHVWNFDYEGGTNLVDVYISYLRKKIDGNRPQKLLRTVRGAGYTLREGDQP